MQKDPLAASDQRKNVILVFKEHERSALRRSRLILELRISYDRCCSRGVGVRILEKALSEFLQRDTVDRLVEPTLRDLPRAYALNEVLRFFGAAELIDARVHRFGEAIDLGKICDAPWHSNSRERRTLTRGKPVAANFRAIIGDRP